MTSLDADQQQQQGSFSDFGSGGQPREKLSILSVLSLVFGLVCVPGFGLIGLVLAIAGLVGITRSKGRVGGSGFALAGILVSTMATALWLGLALGAVQGMQLIGGRVERVMIAVRDADLPKVTREFAEDRRDLIDEDTLAVFASIVEQDAGSFVSTPRQFKEMRRVQRIINENEALWWQEGEVSQALWPATFERGEALVLVRLRAASVLNLYGAEMQNLGLLFEDGTEVWLLPELPQGETGLEENAETETETDAPDGNENP